MRFALCRIPRLWAVLMLGLFTSHGCGAAMPGLQPGDLARLPPVEPPAALATFAAREGVRVEIAAREPEVVDPIAVSFDERGRAYVVEMRDYSERRPERLGRIRQLEDADGDGYFETSRVYAEGLPWPTAVVCWDGGVFIGATPDILYAKDIDNDGRADIQERVFTGFASDFAPYATNQLNVQAMLNSFEWGLDCRIHGSASLSGGKVRRVDSAFTRSWRDRARANGTPASDDGASSDPPVTLDLRGRDFSFDPRTLELRTEIGGGQYGLTFDDTGRKFVCSNSDHLQLIRFEARYLDGPARQGLPAPRVSIAADGPAAEVFRLSPEEPWRVIRTRWRVTGLVPGLIEGGGRSSGYFTSATGLTIYRGDALGPDFSGNAFVADCGSNLIHRKQLRESGCEWIGERPPDEAQHEFLASRDTWFRPVALANAPDGCLWVIDMYREIIEHPWSLPPDLKRLLDLNSGNDRGRLYRIVPADRPVRRQVSLASAKPSELLGLLSHPNAWHRLTASRLLCEHPDTESLPRLRTVLSSLDDDLSRLHAFYLLNAWQRLTATDLATAMTDPSPPVRRHALRLTDVHFAGLPLPDPLQRPLVRCADDTPSVRLQLALSLASLRHPQRTALLARLIESAEGRTGESLIAEAALAAAGDDVLPLFEALAADRRPSPPDSAGSTAALAETIGVRARPAELAAVVNRLSQHPTNNSSIRIASRLAAGLRRSRHSLADADPDHQLQPLLTHAGRVAAQPADHPTLSSLQIDALRLLEELPTDEARMAGLKVLVRGQSAAAQRAALDLLLRDPVRGAKDLWDRWPEIENATRPAALDLLLRRPEGAAMVLDALVDRRLRPADLSATQLTGLRRHPDTALRHRAIETLGAPPASREQAVAAMLPSLDLTGDSERGKVVYQIQCAQCHRIGSEGHALGPDLESVRSQPPEKLLVAIVDPNREVAPSYLATTFETDDEESYTGVVVSENPSNITVRQAGGLETVLPRHRVRSTKTEGQSLMPEGFESTLTRQQLADLLALLTGRP